MAQPIAYDELGNKFVEKYYELFDADRNVVVQLYHPTDALLTFEDSQCQGVPAIKQMFADKLRFQRIKHVVTKCDSQPMADGGVLILVTGRLQTDDDHPHGFSQAFIVRPFNGSYYVFHDVFRLEIHDQ